MATMSSTSNGPYSSVMTDHERSMPINSKGKMAVAPVAPKSQGLDLQSVDDIFRLIMEKCSNPDVDITMLPCIKERLPQALLVQVPDYNPIPEYKPLPKLSKKNLNHTAGTSQAANSFARPHVTVAHPHVSAPKESPSYLDTQTNYKNNFEPLYKNPGTHYKDIEFLSESMALSAASTPKATLRISVTSKDMPSLPSQCTDELIDIDPSLSYTQLRHEIRDFLAKLSMSSPEARANLVGFIFSPDHEVCQIKASWANVNPFGAQEWEMGVGGAGEKCGSETIVTEDNCGRVLGMLMMRNGAMDGLVVEICVPDDE